MTSEAQSLKRLQGDPDGFRRQIFVDADGGPVRFGSIVADWQQADFTALDPAWKRIAGQNVQPQYQRAWIERNRGASKSTDTACMVLWGLFAARRQINGLCAAADKDQARLLRNRINSIVQANPWLGEFLEVQEWRVRNRHTGSELEIISSDVRSSYGHLVNFIVCDELTIWHDRDLFDSLLSTAAKRQDCLLLCIGNAGFTDSWQWELREKISVDERWYFSRLAGPQAGWISGETLDEQKRLLPPAAFARLWLNEWCETSSDAFLSDDLAACVTADGPLYDAQQGWGYVAGLDIGVRHDASALTVIGKHVGHVERITRPVPIHPNPTVRALRDLGYLESDYRPETESTYHQGDGRLRLATVDVWTPPRGMRVDLEEVERRIITLHHRFKFQRLDYDPSQCEYMAERLRKANVPAVANDNTGPNLKSRAQATIDALRDRRIEMFDHKELMQDLRAMHVTAKSYGFRLDAGSNSGTPHGDAATALSIALHAAKNIRPEVSALAGRSLVLYP